MIQKLESRSHKGAEFFRKVLETSASDIRKAADMLIPASTMSQYSGFNADEERTFDDLWEIAHRIHNSPF